MMTIQLTSDIQPYFQVNLQLLSLSTVYPVVLHGIVQFVSSEPTSCGYAYLYFIGVSIPTSEHGVLHRVCYARFDLYCCLETWILETQGWLDSLDFLDEGVMQSKSKKKGALRPTKELPNEIDLDALDEEPDDIFSDFMSRDEQKVTAVLKWNYYNSYYQPVVKYVMKKLMLL